MDRKEIHSRTLANGQSLTSPVFFFKGSSTGPKIYIQASMHGAEVQGNAVIFELIKYLEKNPPLSDITIAPLINPYATNLKLGEYSFGRFEPTSGRNYNRYYFKPNHEQEMMIEQFASQHKNKEWSELKSLFKSFIINLAQADQKGEYTHKINHQAFCLAFASDICLDMHTASHSARHLYTQDYLEEESKSFGIKNIILSPVIKTGDLEGAFVYPWLRLQQELQKLSVKAPLECSSYTLEFGSQERFSLESAKEDLQGVLNFLALKKAIDKNYSSPKEEFHINTFENYISIYTPYAGLVDYKVSPGQKVMKGEVLAEIINFHHLQTNTKEASQLLISEYEGVIINALDSSIAHEGVEVFRLLKS